MFKSGDEQSGLWSQGRVVGYMPLDEDDQPIPHLFTQYPSIALKNSPSGSYTEVRCWSDDFSHLTDEVNGV